MACVPRFGVVVCLVLAACGGEPRPARPRPETVPLAALAHQDPGADTSTHPVLWRSSSTAREPDDHGPAWLGCLRLAACDAGGACERERDRDASALVIAAAVAVIARRRRRASRG